MITGGFGFTVDLGTGHMRRWVIGRDGVQRWADSGEPVKEQTEAADSLAVTEWGGACRTHTDGGAA